MNYWAKATIELTKSNKIMCGPLRHNRSAGIFIVLGVVVHWTRIGLTNVKLVV